MTGQSFLRLRAKIQIYDLQWGMKNGLRLPLGQKYLVSTHDEDNRQEALVEATQKTSERWKNDSLEPYNAHREKALRLWGRTLSRLLMTYGDIDQTPIARVRRLVRRLRMQRAEIRALRKMATVQRAYQQPLLPFTMCMKAIGTIQMAIQTLFYFT